MPRTKPLPNPPARDAAAELRPRPTRWLTYAAIVLAAGVVLARAMMLETLRNPLDVNPGAEAIPRGPGAGTGLLLDLLCWVPALFVLAGRALDRSYAIRFSWSFVPMAMLALWTVASTAWAGDKFAAAVSGTHWLSACVLLWGVAQVVRGWVEFRLVAAVCVGLLLVQVGQGLYFRLVEFPDFVASWKKDRTQILRQRGWEPDSFIAQQFERRVLAGEMMGFTSSPNSYGAVLVLLMFVAAGVAIQRVKDGDGITWAAVPAGAAAMAGGVIAFVGSRTAVATPFLGALALVAVALLRRPLAKHSRAAFACGVGAIALAVAALVGHGLYHGTLFHDSLTFRWRYWVAAARLFRNHPILGVGWDNFSAHYLAYRLPIAAEEIKDPHNFLVRFATELGAVGLFLVLAWLLTLWWGLTQRDVGTTKPVRDGADDVVPASPLGTIAAIGAAALVINLLGSIDWSQSGPYNTLEVMRRVGFLCLFLVGSSLSLIRSTQRPAFDDRPAPWLLYAMLVGLALFLVHNVVDFSLFEPGPMFLFMALCGTAVGIRASSVAPAPRARRATTWMALASSVAVWLVAIGAFAIPVALAEGEADAGDEALRLLAFERSEASFSRALGTVGYNADYAFRGARAALMAGRPESAARAVSLLDRAIALDPNRPQYWLHRAYARLRLPAPDAAAVRGDYEQALRLDPNNVEVRIEYADTLRRFNDPAGAAAQYREALRYNDLLSPDEPKRLPPDKVAEVRQKAGQTSSEPAR